MGLETLALVGIGTAVASGGLSMFGSMQQAKGQENAAAYRAAVARNNAAIREQNAREAERRAKVADENAKLAGFAGQKRAKLQDDSAARQLGELQALQGVSGLRGGSQDKQISRLEELATEDRLNIRRQGDSRASAFRARAQDFRVGGVNEENAAALTRSDAKAQQSFAKFNANTTRLSGVGGLIGSFGQAASIGVNAGLGGSAPPATKLGGSTDFAKTRFGGFQSMGSF